MKKRLMCVNNYSLMLLVRFWILNWNCIKWLCICTYSNHELIQKLNLCKLLESPSVWMPLIFDT